jgi:hypothetical protein
MNPNEKRYHQRKLEAEPVCACGHAEGLHGPASDNYCGNAGCSCFGFRSPDLREWCGPCGHARRVHRGAGTACIAGPCPCDMFTPHQAKTAATTLPGGGETVSGRAVQGSCDTVPGQALKIGLHPRNLSTPGDVWLRRAGIELGAEAGGMNARPASPATVTGLRLEGAARALLAELALHRPVAATSTPEERRAVSRLAAACAVEVARRAAYVDATRVYCDAGEPDDLRTAMTVARNLWFRADQEERFARLELGEVGR